MHKYRLISKKGEGTFSEVLKAQSIKTGKYLAIKCMKNQFASLDKVNNLREIQALRRLSPNPGIIKLYEVLYDQSSGRLALVFELMDMNIYELIRGKKHYLPEGRVQRYMYQLVKSMDHMHKNGIFHRDIKPENILVSEDTLKVADFGSCRGIYSKQPYTEYISTRWYRAPECLLTDGYYGHKMDMWGVGCVMFEVIALYPLFPGTCETDQIDRIHNIIGTPPESVLKKFQENATHIDFSFPDKRGSGIGKLIPHASADCVDIIVKLLAYDPDERMSARHALKHPYFADLRRAEKQMHKAAKQAKSTSEDASTSHPRSKRGKSHHTRSKKRTNSNQHSSESQEKLANKMSGARSKHPGMVMESFKPASLQDPNKFKQQQPSTSSHDALPGIRHRRKKSESSGRGYVIADLPSIGTVGLHPQHIPKGNDSLPSLKQSKSKPSQSKTVRQEKKSSRRDQSLLHHSHFKSTHKKYTKKGQPQHSHRGSNLYIRGNNRNTHGQRKSLRPLPRSTYRSKKAAYISPYAQDKLHHPARQYI